MRIRGAVTFVLVLAFWSGSAHAQTRVIARDTLGLAHLQGLCTGLLGLQLCTVVEPIGDPQGQLFVVAPGLIGDVDELLQFLLSLLQPIGGSAEIDQLLHLPGFGFPNSPTWSAPPSLYDETSVYYYGTTVWHGYVNQPAVGIIGLVKAQNSFRISGKGIIAVIDTGVDPTHPALRRVLLPGYDFTRNRTGGSELSDLSQPGDIDQNASPYQVNQSTMAVVNGYGAGVLGQPQYAAFGHGTMVSGIVHLAAPTAALLPLKAFRSDGTANLSDILRAMYYGLQNGANVFNMSFDISTYSHELDRANQYAAQQGAVSVASVGNDGQDVMVYPAGLRNVMGIASTANNDTRSSFSNYGHPPVWVASPGEGIVSTYPFGTYAAGWGTSFSAPFVSGTVALLRNINATLNQNSAAQAISDAKYIDWELGYGRLDVYDAADAWCQTSHCPIMQQPLRP